MFDKKENVKFICVILYVLHWLLGYLIMLFLFKTIFVQCVLIFVNLFSIFYDGWLLLFQRLLQIVPFAFVKVSKRWHTEPS